MTTKSKLIDCFICCDEYEKCKIVKCTNSCDVNMCELCFETMVQFSTKEHILPKCPNLNCKSEYYISSFDGYDIQMVDQYLTILHKHLMTKHDKEISYDDMKKKLIDEFYKNKLTYINSYPKAITKIISIAYPKKLKSVKDSIKIKINAKLNELKKPCINPLCVGKLDADYQCVLCSRKYCKECEMQKEDEHECDENILKDKEYIKTIPKCPRCSLPILKSWGCDNMTCSHCRTNFSYERGVFTVAGNHDVDSQIKLNSKRETLFFRYEKHYKCPIIKELFLNLDAKYINPRTDDKLIKLLREEISFHNLKKIANEYELICLNKKKYKLYQSMVMEIEKAHKNQSLNKHLLERILDQLE